MSILKLLTSVSLAAFALTASQGEGRCPGNVESIQYHSVGHSHIAVSVMINKTGPYEFLLDTGSQVTVIEPSLAASLDLKPDGRGVDVSAVGNHSKAELVVPDLVEVGPIAVSQPLVAVQSLARLQSLDPRIRGLLGGSFLWHFDLLIDYAHKLLCFDEAGEMRQNLQGEHVAVVQQSDGMQHLPFPHRLLIPVRIAEANFEVLLLMLDSGASVPLLFASDLKTPSRLLRSCTGTVAGNGAQMPLTDLSSKEVRIGTRVERQVTFLVPARSGCRVIGAGEDGLLPTSLFKRVFISYSDHFVIFDPRHW